MSYLIRLPRLNAAHKAEHIVVLFHDQMWVGDMRSRTAP